MKLIIIESGDCLGKNLLIKGLCEHFNYDNVTIRHFGKPPTGLSPEQTLDIQFQCFAHEAALLNSYKHEDNRHEYYSDTIIWNRSHLGEYVYSTIFRNTDPDKVKERLLAFEQFWLSSYQDMLSKTYLITLLADPEFFLSKEDGQSFSKNLEQKTKELTLFEEATKFSLIKNKLLMKVDKGGEFRDKQEILDEAISFIENKRTILEY